MSDFISSKNRLLTNAYNQLDNYLIENRGGGV